jgi:HPt (histidine-containing phosphotransfer) domain-containing protein
VALQLGDDATMESIADQLSQHDNGLQFSLTQGATYQQTLAPIQSPDMGIHSLPSWRLVMHLPARVITMAFIENMLPMALAMLAATSLLWWLIFYGLWERVSTKKIASQGDSEAIFPDKIYPWSFRTGPMQSLHANNLLLSLGYDVSNIDIKNRALLNTLARQEDLARLAEVGSEVLEGLSEGIDLDLRLRHRRGYWVWYNILGRIVDLDKEGKPRRVDGVCIEMTKRKQDEQARANNLQNTRQRYQSHYQFIADISQRMQDNVQRALVQRATLMAESEGAQTVQRALQHLLSQIHQTRAYSMISLEQDTPSEQRIGIATLIEETLASIDQACLMSECKITTTIDTGLATSYRYDGDNLKLLLHLLIQTVAPVGRIERISIVVENCGRTKKTDTLGFSIRASGDDDCHRALKTLLFEHTSTASIAPGNSNINLALAEKVAQHLNANVETALHPSEISLSFTLEMPVFSEEIAPEEDAGQVDVPSDVIINTPPPQKMPQTRPIDVPQPVAKPVKRKAGYEAINPDAARGRMDGQEKILCRIYQRFLLDFEDWQNKLDALLKEQAWVKAKVHAHTLKGASANIDAMRLSTLAAQLEALLKQTNVDEQDAQHLTHLLAQENELVRQEIQHYLDSHQSSDQGAVKLEVSRLVAILDNFKHKLEQGKRLPTDELTAVQHTLAQGPLAQEFAEFVIASQRFEFDKAAALLDSMRSHYHRPTGDP